LAACISYIALALIALYVVWLAKYKPEKVLDTPTQQPVPVASTTKTVKLEARVKPWVNYETQKKPEAKPLENRQPRFIEDGSFVINFKSSKPVRQSLSQLDPNTIAFSPVDENAKLNPEARDFCPTFAN